MFPHSPSRARILLASALWPAGEQRDAFDPDFSGAVHNSRGHGVQGLALCSADGQAHKVARCRNIAEMFAVFIEDLYTVGRRNVKTAIGIEAAAVTAAALPLCKTRPVEVHELALVAELTIRTHIEDHERSGVGDDDVFLVRGQDDPVGAKTGVPIFRVLFRHLAIRSGV